MYFLFVPWAWVFVNCLDFFVILGRLQSGVRFMKLAANVNFSIPADIFLICQTLLKYNLISIVLPLNCKGLSYYLVGISWYVSCRGVHGTARDAMRRWRSYHRRTSRLSRQAALRPRHDGRVSHSLLLSRTWSGPWRRLMRVSLVAGECGRPAGARACMSLSCWTASGKSPLLISPSAPSACLHNLYSIRSLVSPSFPYGHMHIDTFN